MPILFFIFVLVGSISSLFGQKGASDYFLNSKVLAFQDSLNNNYSILYYEDTCVVPRIGVIFLVRHLNFSPPKEKVVRHIIGNDSIVFSKTTEPASNNWQLDSQKVVLDFVFCTICDSCFWGYGNVAFEDDSFGFGVEVHELGTSELPVEGFLDFIWIVDEKELVIRKIDYQEGFFRVREEIYRK